jgi:hypothetical protein
MSKRKIGDVLWLALQCAKSDRQTLADAYDNDISQPAVRIAMSDVKAFEALQIKLFGTTQSEMEVAIGKLKPISIIQLLNDDVSFTDPKYFQS